MIGFCIGEKPLLKLSLLIPKKHVLIELLVLRGEKRCTTRLRVNAQHNVFIKMFFW